MLRPAEDRGLPEGLGPHGRGSYWIESTPPTSHPRLDEDVVVDVAVVGGGIAGLSAAWELTRAGRTVAVLEARRIVSGATGHTTGRLSSLHPYLYRPLHKAQGADAARLYARSQQDAVEHVIRTAERLGIDCEVERRPSHVFVQDPDEVAELRDEGEAVREAGLPAEFVTGTGLPFEVAGALRLDGQVQFHPRRYLIGLADAIVAAGGRVYEETRAVRLDEGDHCTVTTDGGHRVRARDVVLATLHPVFGGERPASRLATLRELVITTVIPEGRDLDGMYITRESNTRSVRTAPYGDGRRLLLITGESFSPGEGKATERYANLARWAYEHFGVTTFEHGWSAQDTKTGDQLPFIGPWHDGSGHVYAATGFARSGMSHGVMAGKLLAALLTGHRPAWADLYDPRRADAPVMETGHAETRQRTADRAVADIAPGSGDVLRIDGRPRAVYRDEDGALHALSAICSYSGCLVVFNEVDRAWESPCHGSRFDLDGMVLDGPATEPLEPVEIEE
ncbi:FAD-dependent oxidoreductase [Actinomadura hibisca]|uniref:FAD-dependent oxidoreductase n=1 Tax=Actinomadura hibisca TaxID=68565 RepID=UPI000A45EAFD|nr:FAD-dependent oxidoreductase [Actinomadura hibisca]